MIDLRKIAISRIAEPLSKGENIKKLLELHISHYIDQVQKAQILEDLKDVDKSTSIFLEWFGVLKGVRRPHTTINHEELNQFFNLYNGDQLGFSDKDIAKPLFFGQLNYFSVGDLAFKRIIKAYCNLTGFNGTVEEYSLFFKNIFGVDIQMRSVNLDLEFIVENYKTLTLDDVLMIELTPKLSQTKNSFFVSPYNLFSLAFGNIEGSKLDFNEVPTSSFYYSLKGVVDD